MNEHEVAEILAKPISQELMRSPIPARLAYTALDGDPRVVPVGFLWTGDRFVVCSPTAAAKVRALRQNPRVALTIDTEANPPKVLLVRGSAHVEVVDGVPDAYLEASLKRVAPDQHAAFEAGVRALYATMAVITITPDWAKLLDFETTIPKAVQDLVDALGDPR